MRRPAGHKGSKWCWRLFFALMSDGSMFVVSSRMISESCMEYGVLWFRPCMRRCRVLTSQWLFIWMLRDFMFRRMVIPDMHVVTLTITRWLALSASPPGDFLTYIIRAFDCLCAMDHSCWATIHICIQSVTLDTCLSGAFQFSSVCMYVCMYAYGRICASLYLCMYVCI